MAQDKELEFYKNLQIMSKVYAEIAKDKLTLAEKNMLLKYLCMALPYKVIVEIKSYGQETQKPWFGELSCKDLDCFLHDVAYKSVKPYLLPLSSMTDEEDDKVYIAPGVYIIGWDEFGMPITNDPFGDLLRHKETEWHDDDWCEDDD